MKVMLALSAYMQAYEAAHHHRIVADRMRELNAKMAERTGSQPQMASRVAERQGDYEPVRREAAAAAVAETDNPPTPSTRPALRAIAGGNSTLNRIDKTRAARAG
jgi:hypothetical protein